jgi:uncharacterized membrane protein YkvA (DUF1232 family)
MQGPMVPGRLRAWARRIGRDVVALWLAAHDGRVPLAAKLVAAAVAAYALSPIDLIPDFVPVLGYLDDLFIVPAGLVVAIKLVPPDVLADCRVRARAIADRPTSRAGLAFMVAVWVAAALLCGYLLRGLVGL